MFTAIAEEFGCSIETQLDESVEVLCTLRYSDNADEVTLGLQNGDELNLGVENFWSYFFPFEEVKGLFQKAVRGWFTGQTRLMYFYRGQRLLKIELQVKLNDGDWQRIYSNLKTFLLPQWAMRTEVRTFS